MKSYDVLLNSSCVVVPPKVVLLKVTQSYVIFPELNSGMSSNNLLIF